MLNHGHSQQKSRLGVLPILLEFQGLLMERQRAIDRVAARILNCDSAARAGAGYEALALAYGQHSSPAKSVGIWSTTRGASDQI